MNNLDFIEATTKEMTWFEIIKFWKPDVTVDECNQIYDKMYQLAYKDAVAGRRDCVNQLMIFNNIKYVYFKELNFNKII